LFWKELGIIFIVSTSIGYALSSLHVNYIAGIVVTIALSYVLLLKINIVTRADTLDFLEILPEWVSKRLVKLVTKYKKH